MPTYVYRRTDGTVFEIQQRITADPFTRCPTTGQEVKRVITGGTGLIFKGTGFYQTDYVSKPKPKEEKKEESATSEKKEKKKSPAAEPAKADAD